MSNVVPLPGHPLCPAPGQSDPKIVRQLERLLEEAKDGQIVAFAYCLYRPTDITAHGWTYGAFGFHLASAIMSLQHGYCELLSSGEKDL